MHRAISLGLGCALVILAACNSTTTEPAQQRPTRPSLNETVACDSTTESTDSTEACRTPYIPWY